MTAQALISLREIIKHKIPFVLVAISIIISYFLVQKNDLVTAIIFLALIPIFAVFRFDGRIPLGYAVSLLIIMAIMTFSKEGSLADIFAIYVYWLLLVGTSCLLIELFKKRSNNSN
jgi:hypothetical protein